MAHVLLTIRRSGIGASASSPFKQRQRTTQHGGEVPACGCQRNQQRS